MVTTFVVRIKVDLSTAMIVNLFVQEFNTEFVDPEIQRQQQQEIDNGIFTGFGLQAINSRKRLTILPSGAFCAHTRFGKLTDVLLNLPATIVFVEIIQCPDFRCLGLQKGVTGTNVSLQVAYTTDEQFLSGLRTILDKSEEEDLKDIIRINGKERRTRCPFDGVGDDDYLFAGYAWWIRHFEFRQPRFLLRIQRLVLRDVQMDVDEDFQSALEDYRGTIALLDGTPREELLHALAQPGVHRDEFLVAPSLSSGMAQVVRENAANVSCNLLVCNAAPSSLDVDVIRPIFQVA